MKYLDQNIVIDVKRMKKYKTILADPPWQELGGGKIKRGADRHYNTMSIKEICDLNIKDLSEDNAHLYLWTTNNFLRKSFDVIDAWGFRYVTTITWMKDRFGLGQYFRGLTEHCLFCVRGNLPYKTLENGKRAQGLTGFTAPRTAHSKKPIEMYQMIEKVSYWPYLEVFARDKYNHNWDVWGNQIECDLEIQMNNLD
jgi:N6-adenosine-specific RNA methylase IME4